MAYRQKKPLPKRMQNAPELRPGLELFYLAFFDLISERGAMGGSIPWTAIDTYCCRYTIEREQREDLYAHLRSMEIVWAEHYAKKREQESTK